MWLPFSEFISILLLIIIIIVVVVVDLYYFPVLCSFFLFLSILKTLHHLSLHIFWQKCKRDGGEKSHCLTMWRLQTTQNHGMHSHEHTNQEKRLMWKQSGYFGTQLICLGCLPFAGSNRWVEWSKKVSGEHGRRTQDRTQRWRHGERERAAFPLMKNLHCFL